MAYFGVHMNLKVIIRERSLSLLILSLRMLWLYVDFDGQVHVVDMVDDVTREMISQKNVIGLVNESRLAKPDKTAHSLLGLHAFQEKQKLNGFCVFFLVLRVIHSNSNYIYVYEKKPKCMKHIQIHVKIRFIRELAAFKTTKEKIARKPSAPRDF